MTTMMNHSTPLQFGSADLPPNRVGLLSPWQQLQLRERLDYAFSIYVATGIVAAMGYVALIVAVAVISPPVALLILFVGLVVPGAYEAFAYWQRRTGLFSYLRQRGELTKIKVDNLAGRAQDFVPESSQSALLCIVHESQPVMIQRQMFNQLEADATYVFYYTAYGPTGALIVAFELPDVHEIAIDNAP